ncbi:hypothetical protein CDEST_14610 [Colletotrichum destructivum]|uniref:Uncharacterized protein n=1 Tax=Colletotrichum destructivum TaxID=34406 RepID=A0AAX4J298_9PEZI|nr:hypothetical protein CDEST_14610 [Colletotrichum destructivum]
MSDQLHDRITRGTQTRGVTHSETHHSSLYCCASVYSNSATSLFEITRLRCYPVALCLFSGHLLFFAATAVLSLAPIQARWATPTQKCILSTSQASLHEWPCGSERHSSNSASIWAPSAVPGVHKSKSLSDLDIGVPQHGITTFPSIRDDSRSLGDHPCAVLVRRLRPKPSGYCRL